MIVNPIQRINSNIDEVKAWFFKFVPMNAKYAMEIAYSWKYNDIYSFYDMTSDEDDLKEFLDENNWNDKYFAALDDKNELVGYFSFYFEDKIMWIGFGLKPELTGRGFGAEFVLSCIDFGVKKINYKENHIMLAVASFNKRAIKVYQNIGFQPVEKYIQKTNGGEYEFIKMKKCI